MRMLQTFMENLFDIASKIIKRCDNFSVMAGNYLPARVLFCYGPKKLFAQLTHAVEVSCISSFSTKGMNNMVCCIHTTQGGRYLSFVLLFIRL